MAAPVTSASTLVEIFVTRARRLSSDCFPPPRRLLASAWPLRIFEHRGADRALQRTPHGSARQSKRRYGAIVDQAAASAATDPKPRGDGIEADQDRAVRRRQDWRVGRRGVRHGTTADFFRFFLSCWFSCGRGFSGGG